MSSFVTPSDVKKLMIANKDVGKITKVVPDMIATAADAFIEEILRKASNDGASTSITSEDIKRVIKSDRQYDFLMKFVDQLPTEESLVVKPKKE